MAFPAVVNLPAGDPWLVALLLPAVWLVVTAWGALRWLIARIPAGAVRRLPADRLTLAVVELTLPVRRVGRLALPARGPPTFCPTPSDPAAADFRP